MGQHLEELSKDSWVGGFKVVVLALPQVGFEEVLAWDGVPLFLHQRPLQPVDASATSINMTQSIHYQKNHKKTNVPGSDVVCGVLAHQHRREALACWVGSAWSCAHVRRLAAKLPGLRLPGIYELILILLRRASK